MWQFGPLVFEPLRERFVAERRVSSRCRWDVRVVICPSVEVGTVPRRRGLHQYPCTPDTALVYPAIQALSAGDETVFFRFDAVETSHAKGFAREITCLLAFS